MFDQPAIEQRAEQPYVALNASITMDGYGILGALFDELFDWLKAHDINPVGPPFVRYLVIDMEHELEIQAAVPVATSIVGDSRVVSGSLPAGTWVTLTYGGTNQGEHIAANAHLQQWVREQGLHWKNSDRDGDELWGGRFEVIPDPVLGDGGGDSFVAYLIED